MTRSRGPRPSLGPESTHLNDQAAAAAIEGKVSRTFTRYGNVHGLAWSRGDLLPDLIRPAIEDLDIVLRGQTVPNCGHVADGGLHLWWPGLLGMLACAECVFEAAYVAHLSAIASGLMVATCHVCGQEFTDGCQALIFEISPELGGGVIACRGCIEGACQ